MSDVFNPDRAVTAELRIRMHSDGGLSIEGPLADKAWCLAVLDHAASSIRGSRSTANAILLPTNGVSLP